MAPPISAGVADFLERIAVCRWLEPDTELSGVTPAGLRAIEDRADEYTAALERVVSGLASPRVAVTRSAPEARARWAAGWREPRESPLPAADAAIRVTASTVTELLDVRTAGGVSPRSARGALGAALATARARSRHWQLDVAGRGFWAPPPVETLAALHVAWLTDPHTATAPSPWLPLVALWERGCWPMLLPGHELLVYIPVHDEGGLVPDPDRPSSRALPVVPDDDPRPVQLAEARAQALGFGTPPCAERAMPPSTLVGRGYGGAWRVPITTRVTTIGRGLGNSVLVRRDDISRHHALIAFEGGRFWLLDRGSSSGSRINDVLAVGERLIARGDVLRIGGHEMRLEVVRR